METVLKTALVKNVFINNVDAPKRVIEFTGTSAYHSEVIEQ